MTMPNDFVSLAERTLASLWSTGVGAVSLAARLFLGYTVLAD